ncbi:MAG TPA: adenylate/guanylate cyclase domain-containing protein [Candidatus Binatia bacterium]|nr:adenylate/guanylate cyclase domain-containing protein [Candidatus Binatia bacterium]
MRCASCGFENPEQAKFCEECGAPCVWICPSCGQQVRPTAKFCPDCGATLGVKGKLPATKSRKRQGRTGARKASRPTASPTTTKIRSASPEAERRQLTVMFCDLVGSTALSEQLDPEELREVVRAYQQASTVVIERYDGQIAQHLGDGLLVYFGYPQAHEDDAQRAVRAGLDLVAAIHQALVLQHHGVQIRIGIHTGLVVVGELGSGAKREQLALGETPNLAARIQGLAEPDTVIVSAATHHLLAGLFECQDLGPQTVKGVSAPAQVYRVLSESSARSRLEIDISTGELTPLVGRAHEVGLVLERWTAAQDGDGQAVLLSGEPGIGKSRLVQEVKEQVGQQGATSLEFRCSPYYQNSAFYPVVTHLQRVLHFERDDTPQVKLDKLQQALARYRFPRTDTLQLLAALLTLPEPPEVLPLSLSPQKQKEKTQDAVVAWLVEEAERHPVYCVWEDLHWADPSTLELLGLLLDQVPTTRLLVLLTARPQFTPPWSSRTHLTPLTLARLPRTQAGEMIEKVTGGKALPAEVQQQIVSKTDGVPLFVEELTKMVLESGLLQESDGHYQVAGPLPPLAIPATLHDSLIARLDRLATVKEVAQLGAVLGREFSYELLRAVAPGDDPSLQQALAKLVEAEVLYQRGLPPQARYVFKHALIQDAAYQSLLKSTRQQYHRQIAQVLEAQFPETTENQQELLAQHYTEAGLSAQAIPYWHRAGQRASQRSANVEAISHLTTGLELLQTLSDTPERAQQELTLQIAVGTPLMATKGFAAPEVERVYARALELCRQVGDTPQLFPALWGSWVFYNIRGELQTSRELAARLLSLAQSAQDAAFLLEAHHALWFTSLLCGELTAAHAHSEQGIVLYERQQHHSLALLYGGHDPGVCCRNVRTLVLWLLGYPDQADQRSQEALTLARELSHAFSLAEALMYATWLFQFRREEPTFHERTEALMVLSEEQGFSYSLAQGTLLRGWVLVGQGQGEEGIAQIRRGLAALQDTGAEVVRPYYLALLAEAYGKVGQTVEGLSALTEALEAVNNNRGARFYEAELYRLKGELTLQSKPSQGESAVEKDAEECFWDAVEIARRQQAKSLELRATMSLARLWQQQGKKAEARQMLADIYGWFTEGFDTKDLQEAKALLEELT